MPILKPVRAYHEALRRIGIQNPGELEIQTPVQLTAPVDDFTHLVAPIQVPVVVIGLFIAGFAGQHSGMEIVAGARTKGVWIDAVDNRENGQARAFISTDVPIFEGAVVPPACFSGPTPESTFRTIRIVTPLTNGGLFMAANDEIPLRFLLAPGQRFQVVRDTVASNANFTIHVREIPTTGDVEP